MNRAKITAALPLAVFVLLILTLIAGLHTSGIGVPNKFAQHVNDPAPVTDLPLLHGEGARFSTKAWRGKPYIVNFFASWCADCRAEHEELMTLAATQAPIIGIIFRDRPDKVAAYLDRSGNPFIAVAQDDDDRAGIDWGLTGVPETFVIDADGIIRWHHSGGLTDEMVSDELMPLWEAVNQ